MVEAGAKEVSEEVILKALELAHAAIKEIIAGIEALAKEARQGEARVHGQGNRRRRPREVEAKAYAPLSAAMQIKDKLENYSTGRQGAGRPPRQHPGRRQPKSGAPPSTSSRS